MALEVAVTYDQLDISNLACGEVLARLYQLTEETTGTMKLEGLEHFVGPQESAGARRGVALAPGLAKDHTE
eukprot:5188412-Amphidinium_carterae.1